MLSIPSGGALDFLSLGALVHRLDVSRHLRRNGEARSVVLGAVDALARRQALHRRAEHLVSAGRSIGCLQRRDIRVDNRHD